MKDFNVKYLRILRLRFGLVGIASFYAPAKKRLRGCLLNTEAAKG
jgi:hypothetical protein